MGWGAPACTLWHVSHLQQWVDLRFHASPPVQLCLTGNVSCLHATRSLTCLASGRAAIADGHCKYPTSSTLSHPLLQAGESPRLTAIAELLEEAVQREDGRGTVLDARQIIHLVDSKASWRWSARVCRGRAAWHVAAPCHLWVSIWWTAS